MKYKRLVTVTATFILISAGGLFAADSISNSLDEST